MPLDGSPLSEMALPTALELLRDNLDATVILLRATEATTLRGLNSLSVVACVASWWNE